MGNFVVNTTSDVVDDTDGFLSLREAVALANADPNLSIITFDATAADFSGDALIRLTQGQLTVTENMTIDGSTAGGAVVITGDANDDDVTLPGTDITDVAASGGARLDDNSRLFLALDDAALSLTALTLTGGRTAFPGGAIRSFDGAVTLTDSTVSGNSTAGADASGGGIYGRAGGVTLTGSTVSDNSTVGANARGGGIFSFNDVTLTNSKVSGNSTAGLNADGGGIFNDGGAVTLIYSTVSGNSTAGESSDGGGIASYTGLVVATNSTIAGNSTAGLNAEGGGIFSRLNDVLLTNTTVTGNSTVGPAAAGGGITAGNVALTNSLVLGNVTNSGSNDIRGTQFLSGGNIVGDRLTRADGTTETVTAAQVFAATEDNNGVAAGVLADNGGPTETVLILAGGAAQEAGVANALTIDQRGEARPVGANDLGAVELQEAPSFVVTIAGDIVDEFDGETSLREAVALANVRAGADTITFDATAADFSGDALIRLTQGELVVTNSLSIDGSTAGGAVMITGDANGDDVTLSGTGITDVAASLNGQDLLTDNSRLFDATGAADLSLTALTLTGGRTTGTYAKGGAIRSADGAVTLTNSTLSGNSTSGQYAEGGGIYSLRGGVTLTGSTLTGNSTVGFSADGGGVISLIGDVTLTNSTLTGNSTTGRFASGGGIATGFGDVTLTNSTVTGNSTTGTGAAGGAIDTRAGTVALTDSLVLGNVAVNAGDNDIRGTQILNGGNIVGDQLTRADGTTETVTAAQVFAATAQVVGGNGVATGVQAGVLADNGGPTETVLILRGGAAEDAGGPTAITNDQRGEARPFAGGANDLGAVELQEPGSLVVTIAADVVDAGDGETSLREAIAFANAQAGADTITFDATATDFTGDAVIRLTQGELLVTQSLTIDGSTAGGAVVITGDANDDDVTRAGTDITDAAASLTGQNLLNDNSRLFNATGAADLSLTALTLTGGRTTGDREAGGAIRTANGALMLTDSTVSGNSTSDDRGDGAGIASGSGDVFLTNSTVSGNVTTGAFADGAGIFSNSGNVALTNSTVTNNSTGGIGADGGGIYTNTGSVMLTDSIVLGNAAGGEDDEVRGTQVLNGGNIVGDQLTRADGSSETVTADQVFAVTQDNNGVAAGVLAENGGPTATVLILAGGAAQDAGGTTAITTDQRGEARPFGDAGDLGAIELQVEPTSLVVTISSDIVDDTDGETSLREAVVFANAQSGADTITFDATAADFTGDALIRLTQGEIEITDSLTIDGSTAGGTVVITGDAKDDDITRIGTDITDVAASLDGQDLLDDNSRLFNARGDAALSLTALTLTGGRTTAEDARGDGGAIRSGDGAVTLTDSAVSGNSTAGSYNPGGGIRSVDGAVTLTNSTVSGNSTAGASAGGGGIDGGRGGVTLINSTVSGNSTAGENSSGGGIDGFGGVTLINSTVTGNSTTGASAYGGGILSGFGGVTLTDSIVLGNVAVNGGGDEVLGAQTLNGGNIVGDRLTRADGSTATVTADQVFAATEDNNGVAAGVLADNGGPTETVLILRGGAAQDAGGQTALATDQRGEARPFGEADDLGAVELQEPGSLVVTIAADVVDNRDDETSLREAVALANAQVGADIITFDPTAPDFVGDAVIRLTQGELLVTDGLTIDGRSAGGAVVITGDGNDDDVTRVGSDITDVAASLDGQDLLADNSRIFKATGEAALSLTALTLTGGRTTNESEEGGAIFSDRGAVTLTDTTVSGNSTAGDSSEGGGIYGNGGDVTLTASTVSGNSTTGAAAEGGGIYSIGHVTLTGSTVSGNKTAGPYSEGGGIFNYIGGVTLKDSTVSGNGTKGDFGAGGGIFSSNDGVMLTNSTVTGNSTAGAYSAGGGISSYNGNVTLTNSTVTGNSTRGPASSGGGVFSNTYAPGSVTLTDSLVLGNVAVNGYSDEIFGRQTLNGGNIVGGQLTRADGTSATVTAAEVFAATKDNNGVASGVLADNGGPTETVLILAGGAAQDAGGATALTTDQRGEARPSGNANDLG
ncbi:MAG: right-handed parallel beta-helix repeat-containing protein, partial [Pseudomonadota bacterium]